MSALETRLNEDLKSALRAGDSFRRGVIQMIRSQILLEKKKGGGGESVDDALVIRLIQGHAKKIRDAWEHAEKLGRSDLVEQAQRELAIAEAYLPAALSPEELARLVDEVVAGQSERSPKVMGAVMKEVLARAEGRADGKTVQAAVRAALGIG